MKKIKIEKIRTKSLISLPVSDSIFSGILCVSFFFYSIFFSRCHLIYSFQYFIKMLMHFHYLWTTRERTLQKYNKKHIYILNIIMIFILYFTRVLLIRGGVVFIVFVLVKFVVYFGHCIHIYIYVLYRYILLYRFGVKSFLEIPNHAACNSTWCNKLISNN